MTERATLVRRLPETPGDLLRRPTGTPSLDDVLAQRRVIYELA